MRAPCCGGRGHGRARVPLGERKTKQQAERRRWCSHFIPQWDSIRSVSKDFFPAGHICVWFSFLHLYSQINFIVLVSLIFFFHAGDSLPNGDAVTI